ncbi:MAG: hypothetical protein GX171_02650 [Clostridiales bacterium]|jgi:hypothetical protein|nr:hypothetical protein [Clostridiales bacterium]
MAAEQAPAPAIRVELDKIPRTLAERLGAAAYEATRKWLESQAQERKET